MGQVMRDWLAIMNNTEGRKIHESSTCPGLSQVVHTVYVFTRHDIYNFPVPLKSEWR